MIFERATGKESAVLVHVNFAASDDPEDLAEFQELVVSAGARPVEVITGTRQTPEAKYFVGSGKAEQIHNAVLTHRADLIIFNHALSPAQERNLEQLCQCRVLDRTGLILDIFAQRARTFEGKLQVELAQLQHLSTRLVRGWTHLERQKGGIGLRGPGETQLESDRRLIKARIYTLKKRLEKVRQQRHQSRRARLKAEIPTLSLVGYTNAGKSTLFNRMTGAGVYVADQLFATLDPTLRQINLPNSAQVVVADTVGFIRHLPHDLIDAFRATLEETRDATLLLHVIDVHDIDKHAHADQVTQVLKQIGADEIPVLRVYNKIDLLPNCEPRIDRNANGAIDRVWVSAVTGEGIAILYQAILEFLYEEIIEKEVCLTVEQGQLRAILYQRNAVLAERVDDHGNYWLSVRLHKVDFEKLFH